MAQSDEHEKLLKNCHTAGSNHVVPIMAKNGHWDHICHWSAHYPQGMDTLKIQYNTLRVDC